MFDDLRAHNEAGDALDSGDSAYRAYLDYYGIVPGQKYANVICEMTTFQAAGERLVAQCFRRMSAQPDSLLGRAIIVHGYYDHVGLYGHLIRHCLDKNLEVYTFDLPGHGLSSGPMADIDSFERYQQVLDVFLESYCTGTEPDTWLMGQSMGGAIVMEHLLTKFRTIECPYRSVVLFAPLVRPALWPVNKVVFAVLRRFIKAQKRSFAKNSHDGNFLNFVRNDPLQARTLPVQWVGAMVDWMKRFEKLPDSELRPMVIQGKNDSTVDWKYNMAVIEKKFDPRIKYIDSARHHLVNETPDILEEMFRFMDGAVPVGSRLFR